MIERSYSVLTNQSSALFSPLDQRGSSSGEAALKPDTPSSTAAYQQAPFTKRPRSSRPAGGAAPSPRPPAAAPPRRGRGPSRLLAALEGGGRAPAGLVRPAPAEAVPSPLARDCPWPRLRLLPLRLPSRGRRGRSGRASRGPRLPGAETACSIYKSWWTAWLQAIELEFPVTF
ncbi:hypothetical protein VULLAG_LOCUS23930 [Vulpes lagopus]